MPRFRILKVDYQEKSAIVRRISIGKLKTKIKYLNEDVVVIFSDPSLELLWEADFIYKNAIEEGKELNFITQKETYDLLIKEGQWNLFLQAEHDKLKKDIKNLKASLPSLKYQKLQERQVLSQIQKAKDRISVLSDIKEQLFHTTLEHFALQAKRRFIVKNSIKFLTNIDILLTPQFIDSLCVVYYQDNQISEQEIREIARSDPWRMYWALSRTNALKIFNVESATHITEYQYLLCSWSKIYDFAFESLNSPSKDIINSDDKFDSWYEEEVKKLEHKRNNNNNDTNRNGGISFGETLIPADAEGAKDVYDTNDSVARQIIMQRQKAIESKGQIEEQNLPDIKRTLIMEANKAKR